MSYDAVLFDNDGVLVDPPALETLTDGTRAAFAELCVDEPDTELGECGSRAVGQCLRRRRVDQHAVVVEQYGVVGHAPRVSQTAV